MATCPGCGSIVMEGDPYCFHCGVILEWSSDDETITIDGEEYDLRDVEDALRDNGYDLDDLEDGLIDEEELEDILYDL